MWVSAWASASGSSSSSELEGSAGLPLTPHPSAAPPAPLSAPLAYTGLFIPPRYSTVPSIAPLALSASLAAPQFSAASGGAPLTPPTRLCLLRACATPAWLRSHPRFRTMPDGPPLAFRPTYRTLSTYLLFCISLGFRLALLSTLGPPLALPMVVGPLRALTLFLRPRLALTLLRWPSCCYAFIRWPSGSFCSSGASSSVGLCVGVSRWFLVLFGA